MISSSEIGVVILVRDSSQNHKAKLRASLLHKGLQALYCQKTDARYEIHCWHYGPGKQSLSVLKKFPVFVHNVPNREFHFGRTRDLAFRHCDCPILVTLSADVVPANDNWLAAMTRPIQRDEADVVQGTFAVPPGWKDFYWEFDGWFWFTSEWREFCRDNGGVALSCGSLAVSRKAWLTTGFTGALFCEDKLIQSRLARQNFRMVHSKEAIAYHAHSYDLRNLWWRSANEGTGWRHVGVRYGLLRCLLDIVGFGVWRRWGHALTSGKLHSVAEVLFPILRPMGLCFGNRFQRRIRDYQGN